MKIQFTHEHTDAAQIIISDFVPSIGDIVIFNKDSDFILQRKKEQTEEYNHEEFIVLERIFFIENSSEIILIITEKS